MRQIDSFEGPNQPTRRILLQAIASAVPAYTFTSSLAWGDERRPLAALDDEPPATGLLRVNIWPPAGHKLPDSTLILVKIEDKWVEMQKGVAERIHERVVDTGNSYQVQVTSPGYQTIERTVAVDRALAVARVYLVPNGWPYYLASGIEVPIEPRPRLASVALGKPLTGAELVKLSAEAEKMGFARVTTDPSTKETLDDVNGSVLYFEPKNPSVSFFSFDAAAHPIRSRVSPDAVMQLKSLFAAYAGRVGSPANSRPGQVRIVDSQYLVSFPAPVRESDVHRFAESIGAIVVLAAEPKWPFWSIEFSDPQNLGRHLAVIARQVHSGVLSSGEPNLLFQLRPDSLQIPPQGLGHISRTIADLMRNLICELKPDSDPYESCQDYLTRQRVQDAWCYVGKYVEEGRYGSPSVLVATIDDGITFESETNSSSHEDVNAGRLGSCHDLETGENCSTGSVHGMAVYGIISAKPDNDFGITGIAPNATHIAIDGSVWAIQSTSRYARILLWTAGLASLDFGDPGQGSSPPQQPAIINCSHSLQGDPVPTALSDALGTLTTEGRGGLGIVLVYATGNEDGYLGDQYDLATHPCTIGVGNTEFTNGAEVRQFREATSNTVLSGSNYGPFIDLCANGEGAATLLPTDDEVGLPACGGLPESGKGVLTSFGGTSAAAPMVSGAAALVLTINPQLSWKQVRQILCASADKVDCGNSTDETKKGLPRKGIWRPCNPGFSGSQAPMPCANVPRGLDWFSDFYGYGRLDVYEAVRLARSTLPAPTPCDLG